VTRLDLVGRPGCRFTEAPGVAPSPNAVECLVGERPATFLGEAIPTVMLLDQPCRD
jgi:hypothetical protein